MNQVTDRREVGGGDAAPHSLAQQLVQSGTEQYECLGESIDTSRFSPSLVMATHPHGLQSEAFRSLRSEVALRWINDRRKALAVTSSKSGHGASMVAANLAIAFSQLGERTLLIDANLRRPSQHHLFGIAAVAGLSGLLGGRASVSDVLTKVTSVQNLSLLCAGDIPPNPQELLSRVGFSYLVETAQFDVVIVDTPPILEFADAQLVAALTGGCLLAVRRDVTRVADVHRVKLLLEPSGATLLGAVVSS